MAEHLREAIFHALVAGLFVEALVRLWGLEQAGERLGYRLLVVVAAVWLPVLEWIAPFRHAEWFQERWSIFASARWGLLRPLGLRADWLWLGLLSALGLLLLAVDLVPFLARRGRAARFQELLRDPPAEQLARFLALCRRMHVPAPRLVWVEAEAPLLLCRGVLRPAVLVSSGALERLDPDELSAALAHELAHVAHKDVLLGWGLMGLRLLNAFNPALHLVCRAVASEGERRADELAARVTGKPLALASGLLKLFEASRAQLAEPPGLWGGLRSRARAAAIEERCRRLIDRDATAPTARSGAWLGSTAALLGALLFFIT